MLEIHVNELLAHGGLRNAVFFVVVIVLLYLAWLSTNIEPLRYRIWVAQLFSSSSHRMLQLYNMVAGDAGRQFFRASGDYDWSPYVTTLIIVRKPNSSSNRSNSNFFRHLQTNPVEEFENQEFSNFITHHVHQTNPPQPYCPSNQTPVIVEETPAESPPMMSPMDLLEQERNNYVRRHRSFTDEWLRDIENEVLYTGEEDGDSSVTEELSLTPDSDENNAGSSNPSIGDVDELTELRSETPSMSKLGSQPQKESNITVELKSDDDSSRFIETQLTALLAHFKKQCSPENNGNIKLFFNDVLLEQNDRSLVEYGMYDKCVVKGEVEQSQGIITIRLKHLDDSIVTAVVPTSYTVGDLKRSHYAEAVESNFVIRFIFQGQLLRNDSKTLMSYGVIDNAVIHVQVGQTAYRQEGVHARGQQNSSQQAPLIDNIQRYGPHPITGFLWLDTALYTLLSCILWLGHWAEADDVQDEDEPTVFTRIANGIRSIIRPVIAFVTNAYMQLQNDDQDPELAHNFGNHFPFVIFLKMMLLVSISYMYQDLADSKTIFLLIIICTVAIFYTYAASAQRNIQR